MASFFKSKHRYPSLAIAPDSAYIWSPPKKLNCNFAQCCSGSAGILACGLPANADSPKHAGADGAPWTFWRIGRAAEDSTHYTRCLPLLCLPVLLSACGVGG